MSEDEKPKNLKDVLLGMKSFELCCKKFDFDPEEYASNAANTVVKIPKELSLNDVALKILLACQNGLEVDSRGLVYIIMTPGTVRLDISYKGYLTILSRDKTIISCGRKLVHVEDEFSVEFLDGEYKIKHTIKPTSNRYGNKAICEKETKCAYGFILRTCANAKGYIMSDFEIMTTEDIAYIASTSKTGAIWDKHYNDMASKTIFKKLLKRQPGIDVIEDSE